MNGRLVKLEAALPGPRPDMGEEERAWNEHAAAAFEQLFDTMPGRFVDRVHAAMEAGEWWGDPLARRAVALVVAPTCPVGT